MNYDQVHLNRLLTLGSDNTYGMALIESRISIHNSY